MNCCRRLGALVTGSFSSCHVCKHSFSPMQPSPSIYNVKRRSKEVLPTEGSRRLRQNVKSSLLASVGQVSSLHACQIESTELGVCLPSVGQVSSLHACQIESTELGVCLPRHSTCHYHIGAMSKLWHGLNAFIFNVFKCALISGSCSYQDLQTCLHAMVPDSKFHCVIHFWF